MKKTILFSLLVLSAGAGLAIATGAEASAGSKCRPIHARIVDTVTSEDCDSPFGLCTVGTFEGSGIDGDFRATTLNLAPHATPGVLSIDALDTITTDKGTLTIRFSGLLDTTTEVVTFVGQSPSGTGRFAGVTGRLYANGAATPTGAFESRVTGELCFPAGPGGDDDD